MTYQVNLDALCEHLDFKPSQVETAQLVYPRGAVPNPEIIWVRVELKGGERKFVTKPLLDFYKYIKLESSDIGGWVSGERGTEGVGQDLRDFLNTPQAIEERP
jgi:hypothetical protein